MGEGVSILVETRKEIVRPGGLDRENEGKSDYDGRFFWLDVKKHTYITLAN